ncbi:MAG: peptidylprolyl isomerase [Nitrospirae bacterium]|nr:peptidylprolyl isomerase [Nitrospirota bacterium]
MTGNYIKQDRKSKDRKVNRFPVLIFSLSSILTIFMISIFSSASSAVEADKKDHVVARVGDVSITETELDNALRKYVPPGSMHGSMDPSKRGKYRKDALNDLVEVELLYKEAKARDIKVSKDDIEQVVDENVKRFGSEKQFKEVLKKEGETLKSFREKIGKFAMVNALLADVVKESEYSDDELKEYFEKNRSKYTRPEAMRIWHILVKVDPSASEDEWLKRMEYAEELVRKIKSGEDFRDVAYKYSEDAWKVKEGDLGFIHRGQLEQEIEDAAFSLKEGDVSSPIRTYSGIHIVRAGEKKPETQLSFEDVKERLRKELQDGRYKEKKAGLIGRLKEKYPVTISIDGE